MASSDEDSRLGGCVRNLRVARAAHRGAWPPPLPGGARHQTTQNHTLQNPTENLSGGQKVISSFFRAPLKGRPFTSQIAAGPQISERSSKLHFLHPPLPGNLQFPLTLKPRLPPAETAETETITPAQTIENTWLTGVHSESDPELLSFMIYATLAPKHPGDTARVLQACLAAQIRQMRDTLSGANILISTEGLQHADIIPIPTSKPIKLLTDERIGDPTAGLSPKLAALPYAHKLTLPSTAPAAIALLALANR